MTPFCDRIARAQEALREQHLAGAVFAAGSQMRYLTGWAEPGHERLIALFLPAVGEPAFVVPAINAEQAADNPAGIADIRAWPDEDGWGEPAADILAGWQSTSRTVAVDDELLSVHLLALQNLAPRASWIAAGDLMARLREIKSGDELARMDRSGALTDAVGEAAIPALREGMTELELQDIISREYAQRGAKPEFALVCFGANTSRPHHSTGAARLKRGDVVILDIGCLLEGYASDITRTVAFGPPDPEAAHVYDVVYSAHRAAFDIVRPGLACEEVDAAARRVIQDAGYGDQFIHRTGHGIGLSTHEPPYIVAGNREMLRPGMCFSDEPGIYLPGRFGVRIENIVAVTEDGVRYINADPPNRLPVVP